MARICAVLGMYDRVALRMLMYALWLSALAWRHM